MGTRRAGQLGVFPKGGDADQIKGVSSGECEITVGNTYYFVRFMKSDFLEYLASPEAQTYFANGNNQYPLVGKSM